MHVEVDLQAKRLDIGSCAAQTVFAARPLTRPEINWFNFSQVFRWIMRNEQAGIVAYAGVIGQCGRPPSPRNDLADKQPAVMIHKPPDVTESANIDDLSSPA